jgi:hypothetical protein
MQVAMALCIVGVSRSQVAADTQALRLVVVITVAVDGVLQVWYVYSGIRNNFMEKTFNKAVPDELYIDSFAQNKTKTYTYTGPETVKVIVDRIYGGVQHVLLPGELDTHNQELSTVIVVDAETATDVAYFLTNSITGTREFETEDLPGEYTYQKLTNPTIRDYYKINYDFETSTWKWSLITKLARTPLNDLADKYKQYIEDNKSKVSSSAELTALANTYLQQLDDFNTTGIGSIPSWKFIEISLADVPAPPSQLVVTFNVLP